MWGLPVRAVPAPTRFKDKLTPVLLQALIPSAVPRQTAALERDQTACAFLIDGTQASIHWQQFPAKWGQRPLEPRATPYCVRLGQRPICQRYDATDRISAEGARRDETWFEFARRIEIDFSDDLLRVTVLTRLWGQA